MTTYCGKSKTCLLSVALNAFFWKLKKHKKQGVLEIKLPLPPLIFYNHFFLVTIAFPNILVPNNLKSDKNSSYSIIYCKIFMDYRIWDILEIFPEYTFQIEITEKLHVRFFPGRSEFKA